MNAQERERRWVLLTRLLVPVHGPALATARRLCRTSADGEDLYAGTVLHAFEKLHTLREESRFKGWFFATLLSRHRSRTRLKFWRRFVPLDEAFPAGTEPTGEDGTRWDDEARRAARGAAALAGTLAVIALLVIPFSYERTTGHTITLALRGGALDADATAKGFAAELTRLHRQHHGLSRQGARQRLRVRLCPRPRHPRRCRGQVGGADRERDPR